MYFNIPLNKNELKFKFELALIWRAMRALFAVSRFLRDTSQKLSKTE